ncbi:MAG: translation initiation factor [Verrucomicrobia bacterium]|nr:translation initiation factor [Verrucomicrobiota bacterium]
MAPKKRGRVELRRLKAGKGGKTVTEIGNFAAISPQELTEFTFQLKKLCGVGGTIRGKTIELQGDQRDRAAAWLQERGFQPIMAGG